MYGFAPLTLINLLSHDALLPLDQSKPPVFIGGVPKYNFLDANSANFQYTFNPTDMTSEGSSGLNGIGYWGTNYAAVPEFICNSVNQNNAFSG